MLPLKTRAARVAAMAGGENQFGGSLLIALRLSESRFVWLFSLFSGLMGDAFDGNGALAGRKWQFWSVVGMSDLRVAHEGKEIGSAFGVKWLEMTVNRGDTKVED